MAEASARWRQDPPHTEEELTERNVETIHRLEAAARVDRGRIEQLTDGVAAFAGRPLFLLLHGLAFAGWMLVNALPSTPHFDPYPFTFLTLVVSLEAIFLSGFILISQNQASRISERRNQLDLQINLLTEQENTRMLVLLDAVAAKLGVEIDAEPSTEVLEQATRPEHLVEQIERSESSKA